MLSKTKSSCLPTTRKNKVEQVDTMEDSLSLQDDISSLERLTKDWLLRFNLDKCHVLTLGKHQNI